ncbi:MAG: tRNA (adenosine(37)-N6)-dimethylallyltransferase MiaA, partial [FCB group bacterium]|nr:tRNA (adenosine(37)-N6)-dimethylallyltransferase MiaA [FCB group bacterium]
MEANMFPGKTGSQIHFRRYPTPILAIVGPTAVGKTRLAIEVAKRVNGEIIGLDSRQIYAGMEIGTAQPTREEQAQVPHHLIGIRMPDKRVSAGEYANLVDGVVEDIYQRGHQPVLCGGAGLYYRAVAKGIFPGSVSNLVIRQRLENEYEQYGPSVLLERLAAVDPEYALIVHPNNKKRLIRALEIYEATGKPPTEHFRSQKRKHRNAYSLFTVLITMDWSQLEERIRRRTDTMLASGWVGEVEKLKATSESETYHPLDSIGYKQILAHLRGELTYEEMVSEINLR